MRNLPRMMAAALMSVLLLSITGCGSSADGKTHLTFQIWDVYQRPGMQAMCDAYTAQHPDVVIEVQATSWSEYWTKLEASAESNTMPDIFWMHTNQLLYYADFGMLADVTDLYDDVESNYYEKHFSEISRSNASGSDGRLYGVPKDKDNGMLVYNKEMFDVAGVPYPTDDWSWEDLVDASRKIYDATGKYGFMAYNDDQLGYWCFVYQAGGHILTADRTQAVKCYTARFEKLQSQFLYLCRCNIRSAEELEKRKKNLDIRIDDLDEARHQIYKRRYPHKSALALLKIIEENEIRASYYKQRSHFYAMKYEKWYCERK